MWWGEILSRSLTGVKGLKYFIFLLERDNYQLFTEAEVARGGNNRAVNRQGKYPPLTST